MAFNIYKTPAQSIENKIGFTFLRTGKAPVIAKRIWGTLADATEWINDVGESATPGLVITVVNDGANNGVYFVKSVADGTKNGELVKLGASSSAESVKGQVDNLAEAIGVDTLAELKDALSGYANTSGASDAVDAIAKLDAALAAVQSDLSTVKDEHISGVTLNGSEVTVTNHVAQIEFDASDITGLTAGNYVGDNDTVASAITSLDTQVKSNYDAITSVSASVDDILTGTGASTLAGVKSAVIGTTGDASSADTVNAAKKYADEVASNAADNLEVTAAGDEYIAAAQDGTDKKKINVSATTALTAAVDAANSALQGVGVNVSGSPYISASATSKANNSQTIEISLNVAKSVSGETATGKVADAYDVKQLVTTTSASVVSFLQGNAANDTSASTTISGAKKYADEVAANAAANLEVTAAGDDYITAAQDATDKKKINVSLNASTDISAETATGKVADAYAVKSYVDTQAEAASAAAKTWVEGQYYATTGLVNTVSGQAISAVVGDSSNTSADTTVYGAKAYAKDYTDTKIGELNNLAVKSVGSTDDALVSGGTGLNPTFEIHEDKLDIEGVDAIRVSGDSTNHKLAVDLKLVASASTDAVVLSQAETGLAVDLRLAQSGNTDSVILSENGEGLAVDLKLAEVAENTAGVKLSETENGLSAEIQWGTF